PCGARSGPRSGFSAWRIIRIVASCRGVPFLRCRGLESAVPAKTRTKISNAAKPDLNTNDFTYLQIPLKLAFGNPNCTFGGTCVRRRLHTNLDSDAGVIEEDRS